jgi:hypothetical protein
MSVVTVSAFRWMAGVLGCQSWKDYDLMHVCTNEYMTVS